MQNDTPINKTSRAALDSYVHEIRDEYEKFYVNSVMRVGATWQILQFFTYAAGFGASLLTALATNDEWRIWRIALPLVGSFAGSVVVQCRLSELTEAREAGRIELQRIAAEGRRLIAKQLSEEECSQIHADLVRQVHEVESLQARSFFRLSRRNEDGRPSGPSQGDPSK